MINLTGKLFLAQIFFPRWQIQDKTKILFGRWYLFSRHLFLRDGEELQGCMEGPDTRRIPRSRPTATPRWNGDGRRPPWPWRGVVNLDAKIYMGVSENRGTPKWMVIYRSIGCIYIYIYGCFRKWWVFPPNHPWINRVFHYFHHSFWGYHHLRKHPYIPWNYCTPTQW